MDAKNVNHNKDFTYIHTWSKGIEITLKMCRITKKKCFENIRQCHNKNYYDIFTRINFLCSNLQTGLHLPKFRMRFWFCWRRVPVSPQSSFASWGCVWTRRTRALRDVVLHCHSVSIPLPVAPGIGTVTINITQSSLRHAQRIENEVTPFEISLEIPIYLLGTPALN